VRVLVADDHPLFREGLAAVLASLEDVEVAGTAADGEEAVALTAALDPDVVIMDLHMPRLDGLEATRRLTEQGARAAVLVLTMVEDDASVVAALRAGARGYLVKGAESADVEHALRAVARGQAVLGAEVAASAMGRIAGPAAAEPFPELTPREREVLDLVARGLTNGAIADRLALGPKTVRNHVSNAVLKIGAPDRAAAIKMAREAGLGR
jgi:DNA-binding NarL/FixJ family response regulator